MSDEEEDSPIIGASADDSKAAEEATLEENNSNSPRESTASVSKGKYAFFTNSLSKPLPPYTIQDIRKLFHLPLKEASKQLKISKSSLQKICRQHKIMKWPYREACSMNKTARFLEVVFIEKSSHQSNPGAERQPGDITVQTLTEQIESLNESKKRVLQLEMVDDNVSSNKRKDGITFEILTDNLLEKQSIEVEADAEIELSVTEFSDQLSNVGETKLSEYLVVSMNKQSVSELTRRHMFEAPVVLPPLITNKARTLRSRLVLKEPDLANSFDIDFVPMCLTEHP